MLYLWPTGEGALRARVVVPALKERSAALFSCISAAVSGADRATD